MSKRGRTFFTDYDINHQMTFQKCLHCLSSSPEICPTVSHRSSFIHVSRGRSGNKKLKCKPLLIHEVKVRRGNKLKFKPVSRNIFLVSLVKYIGEEDSKLVFQRHFKNCL